MRFEGIKTIFLDMDGVIADWNKQFCQVYGVDHQQIVNNWKPGVYEIHDALGISKSKMWATIGANKSFWLDIPPFDYAHEMVDYLRSKYHVRICSSPSSDPLSVADKLRWLSNHKFKFGNDYHINRDKEWLAYVPNSLLIDDMDKKVDKWKSNGGQAFLFPQVWNSTNGYKGNKLDLIKGIL